MKTSAALAALLLATAGCGGSPTAPTAVETCTGFGNWTTSPYVLPYPAGASYLVDQANCSAPGNGHRGVSRYGYDFLMTIGTPIVAARGGTVLRTEDSHTDGQIAATGFDNYLVVRHDDGSTALYGHFTRDGVIVAAGDRVASGELVGYSGNTGNTGNKPHLHFSVSTCDPFEFGTSACETLPVNFRNTTPNPEGLQRGQTYLAGLLSMP